MTAETIIADIENLPAEEKAKIFAYVGRAMEADDSWIPESFRLGMAEAADSRLVEMDIVMGGASPPLPRS